MRTDRMADSKEVAAYLRTTPDTLYVQRHRGMAPGSLAVKVGKKLLWDPKKLEEWLRSQADQNALAS